MKPFPSRFTPETQTTPSPRAGQGVHGWFAASQKPIFGKHPTMKVTIVFAAISIGQAVAIARISNSSGPKPYFVERDKQNGVVYYGEKYAEAFTPTVDNNAYFLRKWATRAFMISLDAQDTLRRQIPLARAWTFGAATKEPDTYITEADPVAQCVVNMSGLTRWFEDNFVSFSAGGNTAYMIVTLTESIAGVRQTPKQELFTVNFLTTPQQLKLEDRKDNPTGTRITGPSIIPYTGITPGSTR